MDAVTIDAGIDLGTTNSAIAVLRGVQTEVIQHGGRDYMPSAVWIDRRANIYVGERARDAFRTDPANVALTFKRLMGSSRGFTFERSGRSLQPEELSAEVLKQLKAVYFERTNRNLRSAVVSVPAEFDLPQIEATKRATQLAGIAVPALVQEPVAAALAYGFQLKVENEFWLVYDWGGGTFDAALVQIRDGTPRVIGHGGNTFLGGSDIDEKIVKSVFLQELSRSHTGKTVDGRQKRRLVIAAEAAKIRLSQIDVVNGDVELTSETGGDPVEFDFTLTRGALETLTEPLVLRTIEYCKRVLTEARLKTSDIQRVILVGGPTMMPLVRSMLADDRVGLGIRVDTTVDPMTAVARGAAIFAGSRLLPAALVGITEGTGAGLRLEVSYQPIGGNVEFLFGGRMVGREGQDFSGFTIEAKDDERRVAWRSGRCPVNKEGQFVLTLLGEEGRQVWFAVELFDPTGNRVAIEPSRFPYTVGMPFTEIQLSHDLRVALKDGRAQVVVPRGLQIPEEGITKKVPISFFQETLVRKGSLEDWLRIPIVEGRSDLANRNTLVGSLESNGEPLQRDIPAGSEIELTVRVSQDRLIGVVAYVPRIDQGFETRFEWKGQFRNADADVLKSETKRMELLLNDVREQAQGAVDTSANAEIEVLLRDGMLQGIKEALPGAEDDPQAAQRCLGELAQVSQRLDDIESRLKWPVLLREAQDVIGNTRKLANEVGDDRDRSRFVALEGEMLRLMSPEYLDELRQKLAELHALRFSILNQQPSFLTERFQYFERRKADMMDQSLGERLIAHGRRAITENDMEALRSVNRQLSALIAWGGDEAESYGSTVLQR